MKFKVVSLILVIILTSLQVALGQNKSEAVLVDKFDGVINFGHLSAIIHNFFQALSNDSSSQGYVVIYPAKDSAKKNFWRERRYENHIKNEISLQKFDKRRISIVRSKERDSIEVEFWEVPIGIEKPFSTEEKWAEIQKDLAKPFVFGYISLEEIFPNFIPEFYADYIKNNENLRGHIVVFDASRKFALERANEWIKVLTEEYKVPRNRLKVFFAKQSNSVIRFGGATNPVEVEFWLVPERKKK
jgi:hypothetical protein